VEEGLKGTFGFSGLIGLITMNLTIGQQYAILSTRLSQKYTKLWIVAEMFLFVLVGAIVNLKLFIPHLLKGFLLIMGALVVRFLGVMFSIQSMELNWKERFFCGISYLPKATVQAAIGAIPLTLGLPNGELILAIAVLSILLTAPIGAILMDITAKTLVPFAAITKKKHAPDLAKN
jgi:NhaP-type Na+/H+ or K+/H+ antiporter